jgi:hypothetical protein
MNSREARDRAEALFKKVGSRQPHPPATEYEAGLDAMRLKTKRLGALRILRDFPDSRNKPVLRGALLGRTDGSG